MYGDEIAPLHDLLQRHQLYPHHPGSVFGNVGIVADNVHLKGLRPLRHAGSDAPQADDPQRLAPKLHAHVLLAVPFALLGGFVGDGNMPRHGQHHANGMFRGRGGVPAGRVNDDDARGRRGADIDIIYAYTGSTDNFEIFPRR